MSMLKDAKTRLQELLQSKKIALPLYEVISVSGKAHQQTFVVSCVIDSLSITTQGKAGSRRKAEQQAAEAAIVEFEQSYSQSK